MEQRIRCGVALIVLAAFWTFLLLPVYGASTPGKGYYVCIGSFKNLTNAEKELKRLIKYRASMSEESISGKTMYRVYIGPYENKDQAKTKARQLQKKKVIASYHVQQIAPPSSGSQIVSVTKVAPKKEQTVTGEAVSAAAAAQVTEITSPPPVKSEEALTPPPATDQTMSAQKPEAPAKAVITASQPLPEKSSVDVAADQQITAVKKIEPETKPEKAVVESPPVEAKDRFLTVGYNLWYVDMTKHYVKGNYASADFMHGPTIGYSKKNFGISFTYLTTMSNKGFAATRNEAFDSGEVYSRNEKFKRDDYDASLRYTLFNVKQISASFLAGFKYTRLYDMSSTYTRSGGEYTITGQMDIWGPALGFEIVAPLGNAPQTPFLFSLGASGMYLKASGNHPQYVPESGGSYGTTFEGAAFSATGWGAYADAHFIWKITPEFQFQLGERYQGANLKDSSPQGYTMRTSNGFFAFYTSLSYDW